MTDVNHQNRHQIFYHTQFSYKMAWNTLADKIMVGILTFLLSGVFGCLPMLLAAKCGLQADHPPTMRTKRKWKNVILAFLLNFGGGVLSANAFCHWLPENIEGIL